MITTVITPDAPTASQTMAAALGLIVVLTASELAYAVEGDFAKTLRRNLLVFALPLLVVFSFIVMMAFLGFLS